MTSSVHTVEWLPERKFREEDQKYLWFHDSLHNNPPITPMGASVHHWPRGTQVASEYFQFPYSLGFSYVLQNGRIYPRPLPITDPEEVRRREPIFQQKLADILENWPQRYGSMVEEWCSLLNYLKGIDKKVLSLEKLLEVLQDAVRISKRSWELHFVGMYPVMFTYMNFESACQKYGLEERQSRIFLQGFETKMYEIDKGLWRLAGLANELKLTGLFLDSQVEDLEHLLSKSNIGQVWLDQFKDFLAVYGRRTTAAIFDPYYKTWIEDSLPVLSTIQTYIQKGRFDFEEHTVKIIEERERLINDTINSIPTPEEQAEFQQILRYAQYTYPFNEDHNFYVEQWTYSELRYAILECGCRLAGFGIIENDEDVFFLTINELENVLNDLVLNLKIGKQDHSLRIPMLVKSRKQAWQELHDVKSDLIIGTIPEERIDDPVFIKTWGLTDEVIRGKARPEFDAMGRFEGFQGSPGVTEGIARVIFGYEGFAEVQPDDILIAPFTTPAWTPLFSKIKGVATDSGGMLAHAAICAREYNIPAVVGTITRGKRVTEGIKTGDRVRIDGTRGVVELIR